MDRRRIGRVGQGGRIVRVIGLALILSLGWLAPLSDPGGVRATTSAAPPASCRAADLAATVSHGGAGGGFFVNVDVAVVRPDLACTLVGQPQLQVRDAGRDLLVASPPPDPDAGQPVVLSDGVGARITFRWDNWCGTQETAGAPPPIDGPLTVLVILPGDAGQLVARPAGEVAEEGPLGGGPPCLAPDQPSSLRPLGPFSEAPGATLGPPNSPAYYVAAPFLAYWRTHGGLALLGYPLSRELDVPLEDGKTYRVQYFERARLEYHPENAAPDDVLLGQLGRALHPADPPVPSKQDSFYTYFPETGHNVEKRFLGLWERGGLAQFGYPLTEEFTERLEDGNEYTVQYFERARFEWHPENPPAYRVLLGQLGRRVLGERTQRVLVLDPASGPCPVANQQQVMVRGSGFTPGVLTRFVLQRDRDGTITAANTSAGGPPTNADGTFVGAIPLVGCGPDEPAGSTFTITISEYRPNANPTIGPRASATFTVTAP